MKIELVQKDAHYCKVINQQHQAYVYKLLSYQTMIKRPWKNYPEKVTASLFDKRSKCILMGLLPYITQKFKEKGISVIFHPIRNEKVIPHNLFAKLPDITFENYQNKILRQVGKNKRGILVAPTGAGKGLIIAGIINKLNTPETIVIVDRKSIFNQTIKLFQQCFPDDDIGIIGGDKTKLGWITIAMYQTLVKFDIKKIKCDLIICDEVHSMNNSIQTILSNMGQTYYRYGLTATPWKIEKEFKKHLKMVGNIGPILYEVDDSVVEKRVTSVDMFMLEYSGVSEDTNYQASFRNDILLSEKRNIKLLKAIKKLALSQNKNCLILLDEISQAEQIYQLATKMKLKPNLTHGGMSNNHNEQMKKDLNEGRVTLLIGTQILGTGVNIPNIDCVALASARKSEVRVLQNLGRGRRRTEDKNKLIAIDFIDTIKGKKKFHKSYYKNSISRMKLYKEKEWKIKIMDEI